MVNTAVIELMLQLPGLDQDMIVNVSVTLKYIYKYINIINHNITQLYTKLTHFVY